MEEKRVLGVWRFPTQVRRGAEKYNEDLECLPSSVGSFEYTKISKNRNGSMGRYNLSFLTTLLLVQILIYNIVPSSPVW